MKGLYYGQAGKLLAEQKVVSSEGRGRCNYAEFSRVFEVKIELIMFNAQGFKAHCKMSQKDEFICNILNGEGQN